MGMRRKRIERVGARGILQLRQALRGGARDRLLRIDQQPRQGRSGVRAIKLAKRQRHLLPHAGIGVTDRLVE